MYRSLHKRKINCRPIRQAGDQEGGPTNLRGKAALVTGGSRGIGAAIAAKAGGPMVPMSRSPMSMAREQSPGGRQRNRIRLGGAAPSRFRPTKPRWPPLSTRPVEDTATCLWPARQSLVKQCRHLARGSRGEFVASPTSMRPWRSICEPRFIASKAAAGAYGRGRPGSSRSAAIWPSRAHRHRPHRLFHEQGLHWSALTKALARDPRPRAAIAANGRAPRLDRHTDMNPRKRAAHAEHQRQKMATPAFSAKPTRSPAWSPGWRGRRADFVHRRGH